MRFESLQELKIEEILFVQGFFSDNGLHGSGILSDSVVGVQLVGDVWVILSGKSLSDGGLHESGK